MPAPHSLTSPRTSLRAKDRCEAIVLEAANGRCRAVEVDDERLAIPDSHSGTAIVNVNDRVMIDIMDDDTARLAYVVSAQGTARNARLDIVDGVGQLELPDDVDYFSITLGANRLLIGREGLQINARQVQVTADGRLELHGKEVSTQSEGHCRVQGQEIHLN